MYTQTLNASEISHLKATGHNYEITFLETPEEIRQITPPFIAIGNGTNLLPIKKQTNPMICLKQLDTYKILDNNTVQVEAGKIVSQLISDIKKHNLGGLEFCYPIPASIGGLIAQNFGAFDHNIGSIVKEITVYNPNLNEIEEIKILNAEDYFSYRNSVFKKTKQIILSAKLKLFPDSEANINQKLTDIQEKRKTSYPLHHTLGSIFLNPSDITAGQLLDECGFKGFTYNNYQVTKTHANIIFNTGNATCADAADLIKKMKQTVHQKKGIRLKEEIVIL